MNSLSQRLTKLVLNTLLALVVVAVLWFVALWVFNVKPFIGKNPFDVYSFLFEVPNAIQNRELVTTALVQTLVDA